MLRAIRFQGPEYVPFETKHFERPARMRISYEGAEVPRGVGGRDRWGIEWVATRGDMVCFPRTHPLADLRRLDVFRFPERDDFRMSGATRELLAYADRERLLVEAMLPYGAFDRSWALVGMETLLIALIEDRESARRLAKAVIDDHIGAARFYLREANVDLFHLMDDLGGQRSLLMAPDTWRDVYKPELARLVRVLKDAGKLVYFHCCGHVMPLVGDLVEIGIDILNPVQARANDLEALGRQYGGRIAFEGGVDTQHTLMRGSPEDVRREVRLRLRQLAHSRGGLILAPDQTMPFPAANLRALFDEVRGSGVYPLADR
jgi:uroporphyrinogen decarboxylase